MDYKVFLKKMRLQGLKVSKVRRKYLLLDKQDNIIAECCGGLLRPSAIREFAQVLNLTID